MAAATARQRHAARSRTQHAPARPPRRVSGPARAGGIDSKPRAVTTPPPAAGLLERLRGLPDHRVIDRLLRGRAWICLVGLALMGIVAMQVSLLKLNSGIGRAVETTATLERQKSQLEASIARLASGERIRAAADKRGMITPPAGAVHFLRVRPGADATRAAQRMRPPSEAARDLMANRGVVPGSLMTPTTTTTATTAVPGTTPAAPETAAAPAAPAATPVAPAPTAAPVSPVAPAPTATAPSSGGTVAAAPTPPQG